MKIQFPVIILSAVLILSCTSSSSKKEPVEEYMLKGEAAESWKIIKDDFNRNGFHACLAKKKTVVSCGGCTGVMLRGTIHINKNGKISSFEKSFDRFCGAKMPADVEECLMKYFDTVEFPSSLRGKSIRIDLGRALKC